MKPNAGDYRADIDGLRAVAVLSVVFCHSGLSFPGGYVGVDVFFVISGYLITGIILKDFHRGTFSLADFWERRIRRILPALLAVTVATLLAGWFVLLPRDYRSLGKSVVGLALLLSNVQFWRDTGYFATVAERKPLLHTWSLSVEEQFYLFVPVFLMLVARIRVLHRVFFPIALAAIVSLCLSIYGSAKAPSATFYLLPPRAWELFTGALLAIHPSSQLVATPLRRESASAFGLALVLIPCFLYDEGTPFPGLSALPPVLGAALLILSGNASGRLPATSRLLTWRPMVLVGLISYSLYLWHWPLLAFAKYLSFSPLGYAERLLLVAASVILSVVSFKYIEVPFRNRRLLATRGRLLAFTFLAFAGLLCSGLVLYRGRGLEYRLPPKAAVFAATSRMDWKFIRELGVEDVPENLVCLGDAEAAAEVLVWGDSHAMAILPAIDSLCRETGIAGRAVTHSSTAPVLQYFFRGRYGLNERAIPFNAAVANYIKSGTVRSVVLAASWRSYSGDTEFTNALLATIDALQADGVKVYFMKDVPGFDFNVPEALLRSCWYDWDISWLAMSPADYELQNRFHAAVLPMLEDRGVIILDPIPVIQARTESVNIPPYDSSGSFYRDNSHLSTYGALVLKPLFAPVIRSLGTPQRLSGKLFHTGQELTPTAVAPEEGASPRVTASK